MVICFIAQHGRLEREAAILATSLVLTGEVAPADVVVAYPVRTPLWEKESVPSDATFALLAELGVRTLPFDNVHFGSSYQHANRIYAMIELGDVPALVLDSDMVALAPLPDPGPGTLLTPHFRGSPWRERGRGKRRASWATLYQLFGFEEPHLRFAQEDGVETVDCAFFNAGAVKVDKAGTFARDWLETALAIDAQRDKFHDAMRDRLYPQLDQISLPVMLARQGIVASALPASINQYSPTADGVLWHYHLPMRLSTPVEAAHVPAALERTFTDPALARYLKDDETISFWLGPEGIAARERAEAILGPDGNEAQLRRMVRIDTGRPLR